MKNKFEPITCPVCSKNVYFAEEVRAMGRAFHRQCFKCCQCSKALDSFTANDHKGSLYCKSCYYILVLELLHAGGLTSDAFQSLHSRHLFWIFMHLNTGFLVT
ncbi:unnamed protein product [Trichobilharzia regenti]|nr:unnamed protein product [Trichobilharzia regenti]